MNRELPPRARRILYSRFKRSIRSRNYLRVRGEYVAGSTASTFVLELPPRARRIRVSFLLVSIGVGTTSACAENTFQATLGLVEHWNYLRVRGEY